MNGVADNSSRSFPAYPQNKQKNMTNTYNRGKKQGSDRYSSDGDFTCLEEENEDCSKLNSEEEDSPANLTDITDKKSTGKCTPFGKKE